MYTFYTPQEALFRLISGNNAYLKSNNSPGNISPMVRAETAINGQHPYAVILTCSDSRVPPEHIFSAGIGELFVLRTAGNVVGDFELGTIEYGTEHLGASIVLVMGHSRCGAIAAALAGHADGHIEDIVQEIRLGLNGAADETTAIYNNILQSKRRITESPIVQNLLLAGKVSIVSAKYDIETGKVDFLDC